MSQPTQPSGAGFIAVDKILHDLIDRKGLRQAWYAIDPRTQADIKHEWALCVTEVLDMQAVVIKFQASQNVSKPNPYKNLCPCCYMENDCIGLDIKEPTV